MEYSIGTSNLLPMVLSPVIAFNVWQIRSLTVQAQGSASLNSQITFDFGDGSITNAASVIHTYASQGTYKVTIAVTNNLGLGNVTSTSINVIQ
jgi:PKD repeat protein